MKQKILKCGVISWVILIAIWGLGSLGYDEYFLPSPAETIAGVKELILNGTLWIDIIASISRVLRGWLLAVVLGVPLGLLVGNFKAVRFIIEPILSFFIPVRSCSFSSILARYSLPPPTISLSESSSSLNPSLISPPSRTEKGGSSVIAASIRSWTSSSVSTSLLISPKSIEVQPSRRSFMGAVCSTV